MTRTTWNVLILVLIAGLLLGGVGLARGRADPAGPAGPALPLLAGLPIGSEVEVAFFDADPASGGVPLTTLAITVGVDSEAAFGDAFAEARAAAAEWEAAFLVVGTSAIRRTIDLPVVDAAVPAGRPRAAPSLRLPLVGLDDGDTITVEFYDADPAGGGNLLETLAFAYGVDSAIGFRAAVAGAVEGAAVAVVTTSPRSVTLDLKAAAERAARAHGMAERAPGYAERLRMLADRLGDAPDGWDGAPMAPRMRGRR